MTEPRLFYLGRKPCELPPGWRGTEAAEEWAIEVAPGVRVSLTGTGDFILPDGQVAWGAGIAVWTAETSTCRHCGGELIRCDPPHDMPACLGWKHAAWLSMGPVGPHYCEGRSVSPSGEPATGETREGNG
jgi:hypothetical protein